MSWEYRFYRGAEERRYCYAKNATYHCLWSQKAPPDLAQKAKKIGIDLDRMFDLAHKRSGRLHHYEGDKRTELCATCGARLIKDGYATWVEAPWDQIPKDAYGASKRAINERLGGTHSRVPNTYRLFPQKSDAISFSLEQATIDKQVIKDEEEQARS